MVNNATSRVNNRRGNANRRSSANSRVNAQRAFTKRFWELYYINLVRIGAPAYMIRQAGDILFSL